MSFDNKDLEAEVTKLTMRSNGIALDESGRITFLDFSILETIVARKLLLSKMFTNHTTNYLRCWTNVYKCGKNKMTIA
jgi:hypothetical protein